MKFFFLILPTFINTLDYINSLKYFLCQDTFCVRFINSTLNSKLVILITTILISLPAKIYLEF